MISKRQMKLAAAVLAALAYSTWVANEAVNAHQAWAKQVPAIILLNPFMSFGGGGTPPSPSYGNPGGTGDRSALITVTSNMTPSSGTVSNLVDGASADNSTDSMKMSTSVDQLKYFKFDFATAKCIEEFKVFSDLTNNHGTWEIHATNDDVSFILLKSSFTLSGAPTGTVFAFTNTLGYRYYYLRQEVNSIPSTTPWIREIEFKIDAASAATVSTTTPNYLNKFGWLDRTGFVTATYSGTLGAGTAPKLLNGTGGVILDDSSNACWMTAQSGKEWKFDFGSGNAPRITEALWWQSTTASHGTWQWWYSDDDSSYTAIGSSFTLGGAGIQLHDMSAVSGGHRYYKLIQSAGTSSTSPWLREVLFKASIA